ncbi:MAG: glycosyltransferase family 39 protein, partial [Cytophagales bacterium]|nr:glycosyltransferase family 39 protein [Cytophagales bacterium]
MPTAPENSLHSVIEYSKADQPPLFFIYIHYIFKIFGYNEIVGRIACAFIGLLSIPIIYFLGKEYHGKLTGIFAALLTGINYFHIYYSQELRFYTMAFFFASLSYLFYIRAFKYVRLIDFIGYSISTVCLLYTHYFGLIIFGTQALTFLILLKGKRNSKFVLLSISAAIVTL